MQKAIPCWNQGNIKSFGGLDVFWDVKAEGFTIPTSEDLEIHSAESDVWVQVTQLLLPKWIHSSNRD